MPRKLAPYLFTTAIAVTLSGAAFARRPPALAEREDAVARVLAQCPQAQTSGYRDMLVRFEPRVTEPVTIPTAAPDLVITCAGETVHASNGYRDIFLRFEPENTRSVAARLPPSGW
ncbi:MAG TPA: hypothetical protein VM686_13105 [Polyangiaceae bacterium]|jgi:hypothetical protein|nr:hypothetical protein [Vicinamibacterales bacterium]HVJ16371.1 hypothetical protein [Polyangiaceae bacterium]